MMLARLFEQRDKPLDLAGRIFVGFFSVGGVIQDGVYEDSQGLSDPIENQQLIGNQKIHCWRLNFIARGPRNDWLDIINKFVSDKTDSAASESRQTCNADGPIFSHDSFDNVQLIADLVGRTCLRGGFVSARSNCKGVGRS